jgi:hypothetical protein
LLKERHLGAVDAGELYDELHDGAIVGGAGHDDGDPS